MPYQYAQAGHLLTLSPVFLFSLYLCGTGLQARERRAINSHFGNSRFTFSACFKLTGAALDGPHGGGCAWGRRRPQRQAFVILRTALFNGSHVAVAPHAEAAWHWQVQGLDGLRLQFTEHRLTDGFKLTIYFHLAHLQAKSRPFNDIQRSSPACTDTKGEKKKQNPWISMIKHPQTGKKRSFIRLFLPGAGQGKLSKSAKIHVAWSRTGTYHLHYVFISYSPEYCQEKIVKATRNQLGTSSQISYEKLLLSPPAFKIVCQHHCWL